MREEENLENMVLRKQRERFWESMSNTAGTFTLNEDQISLFNMAKWKSFAIVIIGISIEWWG